MTEMKNNKKIKNDIIFIVALLLALALIGGCLLLFRKEGVAVEVKVAGEIYGMYSLSENQTVEIRTGENGENYNILVIEDGKAYVSEANCPGADTYFHKCTNKKPISYTGESILCREHLLVIAIVGGEENSDGLDIIS